MKKIYILGLLILTLILIAGCGETPTENVVKDEIVCNDPYIIIGADCCLDKDFNAVCDKDEVIEKKEIDIPELEKEIHTLVNKEREKYHKYDIPELQFDTKLSEIAREHSKDMIERNFFNHINFDGDGPTERGISAGYSCYKPHESASYYAKGLAENIYRTWDNGDIARSTVSEWMKDERYGYRESILDLDYDSEGIGIAISSDGKIFITQLFC